MLIHHMHTTAQSIIPLLFIFGFGLISWLWILTTFKSHRLLKEFKEKMPQQAFAIFPEAFYAGRNPKKVLFFFTEEAAQMLSADQRLSKMRSQFVRLAVTALVLPFLIVLVAIIGASLFTK